MKKILLLILLFVFTLSYGQIVDSGLDSVGIDASTNQIKPNSCKGGKSLGVWWACGYMELESGAAKYPTNKGPQLRQKMDLTQGVSYTISFDAWKVDDPGLDTQRVFVTFQEDPGDGINLNTVSFEVGLAKIDVGFVSTDNKWTYLVENTTSQNYSVEFTPTASKQYIFSLGRGSNGDLTYVDNILMTSPTAGVSKTESPVFDVYPNPASGNVTIESNSIIKNASLVNSMGQIVFSTSLNAVKSSLDISSLSNGLYVLNIKSDTAVQSVKLLID
ncbi:MAG: T9SS type A sorting domain-containing protein [Flavicella sp.]